MGDRSQIAIKQPTKVDPEAKIYLYSHWGGADVFVALQETLARKQRWDDAEYLSRMIFCRMVKGSEDGETGFGIGNSAHGDIEHLIPVLDCAKMEISFEIPEWEHNKRPDPGRMSFKDFLEVPKEVMADW